MRLREQTINNLHSIDPSQYKTKDLKSVTYGTWFLITGYLWQYFEIFCYKEKLAEFEISLAIVCPGSELQICTLLFQKHMLFYRLGWSSLHFYASSSFVSVRETYRVFKNAYIIP